MATDAYQNLQGVYQDFAKSRFPKLGYVVEGFPEADSVLAGLVDQALSRGRKAPASDDPIIASDLASKVASTCQAHQGSQDAAELEAYFEKMKRVEAVLLAVLAQDAG